MSIEIKAYKCEGCGDIYEKKEDADNCCKCKLCKHYVGEYDKICHWIHCRCGYTCDSYFSEGTQGTYSKFESK